MSLLQKAVLIVVLSCVFCAGGRALGTPTIGAVETWDGGTLNGWSFDPILPSGTASSVDVGSIGGHDNAVRVMFGDQGGIPEFEEERVFATDAASSGNFTGDYSAGGFFATFKFYADDYTTASDTLSFFLHSGTSGRTWKYSLDGPATIDTWYSYYVPIGWSASWSSVGAGEAEFNADLALVDQIGIWVYRSSDTGAQDYGLDDFSLGIPEPSTWAMLAFTALTLGLTLRRKQALSPAMVDKLNRG